jgi:hypothetical protein
VQLRLAGSDRPRDALAAALAGRVHVDDHGFSTTTLCGGRRLRVRVELPPDRCVVLAYTDPDGAGATCTNSERADVRVELDVLTRRGWRRERAWTLDGTGHAEIGRRP